MKATELSRRLKEITGASTHEEVLDRVEALAEQTSRGPEIPFGVSLIFPNMDMPAYPVLFGMPTGLDWRRLERIQAVCFEYAHNTLGSMIDKLKAQEIEMRVRQEMSAADNEEERHGGEQLAGVQESGPSSAG